MRQRKTLAEDDSEDIKTAFKERYRYDAEVGEIYNRLTGRTYDTISYKGYKRDMYLKVEEIEYRSVYHRLCWFLYYNVVIPADVQIDHINNIKTDNRIINLRLCSNAENALKQLKRTDNTTGYKGISHTSDWSHGKQFFYYGCSIAFNNKTYKIGRFKDPLIAAKYYDSANRFYFKDFSKCNFEEEFIPPMSCADLRKLKKQNKH